MESSLVEQSGRRLAGRAAIRLVPAFALLVPALEMLLMATPFAAYFYGAYSPVLRWTRASVNLVWLGDFFIPHLTRPAGLLPRLLFGAPRYLLYLGLASFAVHAVHLYWTRFMKGSVAQGLLYRHLRHPQYLSLAVAGIGLVFHWPRFINLVLYLVMLAGYLALARHEEAQMERTHGEAYRAYRTATGGFLPRPLGRALAALAGRFRLNRLGRAVATAVALLAAFSTSFALRAAALRTVDVDLVAGRQTALVLYLASPDAAERSWLRAAATGLVPADRRDGQVTLFYAVRTRVELEHLLVDSGFSYRRLGRLPIAAARFYLMQAEARYPCPTSCRVMTRAHQALSAQALRTPVRLYGLTGGDSGLEIVPYDLPADAWHAHAMLPSL
jgi:protein-S-isoprenylcysteine O-methyltransferase Ste14